MFEAVVNVSEGIRADVIASISDAIDAIPGVTLLNVHSDADHNRSVFTYIADDPEAMKNATISLYEVAVRSIDLRQHRGAHPRVGAVDVTPFVPLEQTLMQDCVALAESVGAVIGEKFGIPVYLYEHAARADHRRELPIIRSGGFENFAEKIKDERWLPDFGPTEVHPSAGVTIVGARVPLVAFNVQLGTDRIEVAEKISRAVRGISGGLRFVRAIPVALHARNVVQVSMNLLDYRRTPIHRAFNLVQEEAARWGVEVISSEIVGLVPADALFATAEWHLRLEGFTPSIVLERRIEEKTR